MKDLFGQDELWREEWENMPEFIQEDLTSYRKIIVHFRCKEDAEAFAKLLGQKIGKKQPSIWYPEMPPRRYADKVYVDES